MLIKKTKRTNGLILTIPMETRSTFSNFKEFEKLSIDFWKYMVLKKGSYQPKNFLSINLLINSQKSLGPEIKRSDEGSSGDEAHLLFLLRFHYYPSM